MSKTYVCEEWIPRNEYTRPLEGRVEYRNSGIIKAVTSDGERIQIGEITFESFENEEFQYIISPFWEIIDTLPASVFQGIPGIDMELRLRHYYRVNYVPVFITERTPGPSREDLWELLDSVGLDYYDRLEWLIRTELRAASDNLIVERAREEVRCSYVKDHQTLRETIESGQFGDEIVIENLEVLGRNSEECTKMLNRLMHYGICLSAKKEDIHLSVEDYKDFLPVFSMMYHLDRKKRKRQQSIGIEKSRKEGKYKGRKRKEVDSEFLEEAVRRFRAGEMPIEEALAITNLSRSTFYRRMQEMDSTLYRERAIL